MGVNELKDILIKEINLINDPTFLSGIHAILASKLENDESITSIPDEVRLSIEKSRADFLKGDFKTQNIFMENIKSWLKSK